MNVWNRMRKLIVFLGLDGASKSTQIALLKNNLDKIGVKNLVVCFRGYYSIFETSENYTDRGLPIS
jgi:thymidylate kinase